MEGVEGTGTQQIGGDGLLFIMFVEPQEVDGVDLPGSRVSTNQSSRIGDLDSSRELFLPQQGEREFIETFQSCHPVET